MFETRDRLAIGWRDLKRYPNYIIHASGTIRSKRTLRDLKWQYGHLGYPRVQLQVDRSAKTEPVSYLVLETFMGPPEYDKYLVRHIDGDRDNVHLSNLTWVDATAYDDYTSKMRLEPNATFHIPQLGKHFLTARGVCNNLSVHESRLSGMHPGDERLVKGLVVIKKSSL